MLDSNMEKLLTRLFRLNRIVGLMFFEFPVARPWPKLSVCYSVALFSGYCYLWRYSIKLSETENVTAYQFIRSAVIEFYEIGCIIVTVPCVILQLLNNEKMKQIRKHIESIDEILEAFGFGSASNLDNRVSSQIVIICSTFKFLHFSTNSLAAIYYYKKVFKALIKVIVFEFPLILNCVVFVNFAVMISFVRLRFKKLNMVLQNLLSASKIPISAERQQAFLKKGKFQDSGGSNNFSKNQKKMELAVIISRRLYLDLCQISREINGAYSKQIVMLMLMSFLYIILVGYSLYVQYLTQGSLNTTHVLVYTDSIASLIITTTLTAYIVLITVNVVVEAKKTCEIAHGIEVPDSQSKIYDEIDQLSLQVKQHPLHFTGYDLFILDFSYLRRMLGSSLIYMMILIQYHKEVSNYFHIPRR